MESHKQIAAFAALGELPQHGIIGLGSGSTAEMFIEMLAPLVRAGRRLVGVPTSESTRALAARLAIPLLDEEGPWSVDVNVDGADEVSDALDLIKGGGGAHAREKIVNYAARRNVIVVDASKRSSRLGERRAVPVEVLPFGHATTRIHLEAMGRPVLRLRGPTPWRTDSGNLIYDLETGPIDAPARLHSAIRAIPGVVETGLFLGRADVVLVGDTGGVQRLAR